MKTCATTTSATTSAGTQQSRLEILFASGFIQRISVWMALSSLPLLRLSVSAYSIHYKHLSSPSRSRRYFVPFFRRSGVWTDPVIIPVGATTAQISKPFTPTIQLKCIGGLPITCPARDALWALIWRYVFYKMSMLVLDVLGDATVVQQKTQAAVCMFILLVYITPCSLIKWIQERKRREL